MYLCTVCLLNYLNPLITQSVILHLLLISVDKGIVLLCLFTYFLNNILPDRANRMRTADSSWWECTVTLSLDVGSILITHQKRLHPAVCFSVIGLFSGWLSHWSVNPSWFSDTPPPTHPHTHRNSLFPSLFQSCRMGKKIFFCPWHNISVET